ncbi:hypothetical protein ABIC45_002879 [Mucilaginibacter rubeus]|uniref:alginate lyase family protein n=1 Tax=Mucilaginibacter rubeus TaxID=2027860 RepID=UPI00339B368F
MKTKQIYLVTALLLIAVVTVFTKCTKNSAPAIEGTGPASQPQLKVDVASPFIHPGILNTTATLDYVAQQANANDAARLAAYQHVLNYCNGHSPSNAYKATVYVQGGYVNDDEKAFKGDALLAYALALRWAKTGTTSYATTARSIIVGWANAFRQFGVVNQPNGSPTDFSQTYLEASWAAPTFAAAAEILRYYKVNGTQASGWLATETTQTITFLNRLKDGYINNVPGKNYHNNWDMSAGYAKMAIGVFEDDQAVYQSGVTFITNVLNASSNPLEDSQGYMNGEVCGSHNDCVHFQYALTALSYAANIGAIQNDQTLYNNPRGIALGYQFQYRWFNNQLSNPPTCASCSFQSNTKIWPGICVANRHYNSTETNSIDSHYNPDSDGLPGGDIGFLCWTDYTHRGVPL